MIKYLKHVNTYIVNALYLIFNKVKGCFEEIKGNTYLTLVPTNKSKETKKYEELGSNIRELIRLIIKNSDDHDEKYIKIKCNSDDKLPLNKTIKSVP